MRDIIKRFLVDSNGDLSSKRLWGSVMIMQGLNILTAASVVAITSEVVKPNLQTAYDAGFALCGAGAALLGIGVIEWFAKKEK